MRTVFVLLCVVVLSGCADLTPAQQQAMLGTLLGTTVGALSSEKNSKRNAMIGGVVGLAGALLVNKNQQQQAPATDEELLAAEIVRLRQENAQLRGYGAPTYAERVPYRHPNACARNRAPGVQPSPWF